MLAGRNPWVVFAVTAVVAFALIVGAQTLAAASAPPVQQLSQTTVIGQTGFAYLGGLRLMVAGLLWGRLDAQFHQYMAGKAIEERLDLLPSIRLVQLLNPQLEQPYYYASFVLMRRNQPDAALSLALEGIKNNPTSGLLRSNYVQLLQMQDERNHTHKNLAKQLEQVKIGLLPTTTFISAADQFEAYGVFRTVFQAAGDQAGVQAMNAAQQAIDQATPGGAQSTQGGFLGLINDYANSATPKADQPAQPPVSVPATK
jgi:hypothetical protein